jgi:hypothetical protein
MTLLVAGDTLGDPLPGGFSSDWRYDFTGVPTWRKGKAVFGAAPQPIAAMNSWLAGYVHTIPCPQQAAASVYPWLAVAWESAELAVMPTGDLITQTGISPFTSDGKSLSLVASKLPPALLPYIPPQIVSGVTGPLCLGGAFNSFPFGQQYGVFELTAQLPAGPGFWPAFWLLPISGQWPPEIDIFENRGVDPTTLIWTVHDPSFKTATNASTLVSSSGQLAALRTTTGITVPTDLSLGLHTFSLDWGPNYIRWYTDGMLTMSVPTPVGCHQPMYVIVDFTAGGPNAWGGNIDATTVFPSAFRLFSLRVAQRAAYQA